jgi:hypothetical protein
MGRLVCGGLFKEAPNRKVLLYATGMMAQKTLLMKTEPKAEVSRVKVQACCLGADEEDWTMGGGRGGC